MSRSGKKVTSTRGRNEDVFGSKVRPTSATRPTVNPNSVTGAPTDRPRSDSLKYSTKRRSTGSGCVIAMVWS